MKLGEIQPCDLIDLGLAGDEVKKRLGDVVRKCCAEESNLKDHSQEVRDYVATLPGLPGLVSSEEFTIESLAEKSGVKGGVILEVFLPNVFLAASEEFGQQDERPLLQLPGKLLLKHCFFQLKELEDTVTKAGTKYTQAQQKYAKYKSKVEQLSIKKRKAAERHCNQILHSDTVDKEQKLARRNQTNRKRKGIQKIKKIRSEEALPEAGYFEVECI